MECGRLGAVNAKPIALRVWSVGLMVKGTILGGNGGSSLDDVIPTRPSLSGVVNRAIVKNT